MATRAKNSDAETAKELLLWARRERIVLQHVEVNGIALVVRSDRKMTVDEDGRPLPEEARRGILEEYGGALLQPPEVVATETVEPTVEDDE